MFDKKKLFIIGGVVLLLLLGTTAVLLTRGGEENEPEVNTLRANTLQLAQEYLEAGEYQRALDLVDRILLEDASDEEASTLRDEILREKRVADEAAAREAAERQSSQDDPELSARRAEAEARQREAEAAARTAEAQARAREAQIAAELAAEQQRRAEEQRLREEELAQQREEELARLSAAEREKQQRVDRLLAEGLEALEDQRFDTARESFDEVLGIDLENQAAEDTAHALALARSARSYFEEDSQSLTNRQTAIRLANRSVERDDEVWEPHYLLGQIYQETELYDDSIQSFRAAARLNPEDPSIFFELGNSQFRAGRYRDARASYQTTVGIDAY